MKSAARRGGAAVTLTLSLAVTALAASIPWTSAERWSSVLTPKRGPAAAIGGYNAGCLRGAVALLPLAPGFEVLHLGRHRYFGHPSLIAFVRRLAGRAAEHQLPALLIGDLAQARGGPTPSDHGSHQSGLDVDVSYSRPGPGSQSLTAAARESFRFPAVVDPETGRFNDLWGPGVVELLRLAATDPAVDRIFVNPLIKQQLCSLQPQAEWLARLRPWWGHNDHFHARLECPKGDSRCHGQPPLPPGNGCDETLAWWIGPRARREHDQRKLPAKPRPRVWLPAECRAVLGAVR